MNFAQPSLSTEREDHAPAEEHVGGMRFINSDISVEQYELHLLKLYKRIYVRHLFAAIKLSASCN